MMVMVVMVMMVMMVMMVVMARMVKIGDDGLMQMFPSKIHNLQPLPEKLYCNPGCGLQGCEMEEQDEEEQEAAEELDELRASM